MLNPVFHWVCFAVFCFADYHKPQNSLLECFDVWRMSTNIETINEIGYRGKKWSSEFAIYMNWKQDFHIFILFLFYIYPLAHFLPSLHFTPSLQTQSAFYTQSAFCTQSAFYTQSVVCSLCFTLTVLWSCFELLSMEFYFKPSWTFKWVLWQF